MVISIDIRWILFLVAVSFGAFAEMFNMLRNKDKYQMSISIFKIFSLAFVLTFAFTDPLIATGVLIGFAIIRGWDMAAEIAYLVLRRLVVEVEAKKWDIHHHQTNDEETNSKQTSDGK